MMLCIVELRCNWEELKDWDIIGVYSDSAVILEHEILKLEGVGWELHIAYKVYRHGGMWGAVMTRDSGKWDLKTVLCVAQSTGGLEEVMQQALPGPPAS